MRIIVTGATGTIGQAVVRALQERHEVVRVGHSRGEHQVDILEKASIERLLGTLGSFDTLMSTAGQVKFGPLAVSGAVTGASMSETAVTAPAPRIPGDIIRP